MRRTLAPMLLALTAMACSLGSPASPPPAPTATLEPTSEAGLANPASVYCLEQGGTLEIRNTDEGQVGYCTLPDGTVCEEWAFYRGECPAAPAPSPTVTSLVPFSTGHLSLGYPPSLAASLTGTQLPASAEGGPGEPAQPARDLVTLEGYRIAHHRWSAQIIVYPLDPAYPQLTAAQSALAALLGSMPAEVEHSTLPFYPPTNAGILFHARLHALNFQNGSGVAYLAQLGQAYGAITNYDLLYVFQGRTDDGAYYVSAFLPLNAQGLVDEAEAPPEADPRYQGDFEAYARLVADDLNSRAADDFIPSLDEIETMLTSMEIH